MPKKQKDKKMPASNDKPADKKQVFDVAKPGKTPPTSTSRPIIVTHQSMVKDPTLVEDSSAEKPAKTTSITVNSAEESTETAPPVTKATMTHGEKVIQPLDETKQESGSEAEAEPQPKEEIAKAAENEEPEEQAEEQQEPEAQSVSEAKESDAGEATESEESATAGDETSSDIDATAAETGERNAKNKVDEKALQEEQEHTDAVTKLIEDKTYFVKVGEVRRKRRSRNTAILLIILILLAGTYLAVDAGLVKTDINLPYDFIKNNKSESVTTLSPATQQTATKTAADNSAQAAQTYANKGLGMAFSYPTGWTVVYDADNVTYDGLDMFGSKAELFGKFTISPEPSNDQASVLKGVLIVGSEKSFESIVKTFKSNYTSSSDAYKKPRDNQTFMLGNTDQGFMLNQVTKTDSDLVFLLHVDKEYYVFTYHESDKSNLSDNVINLIKSIHRI
jgi:hypothetical protein